MRLYRILSLRLPAWAFVFAAVTGLWGSASQVQAQSAAGPFVNLLKSGALPDERVPDLVQLICERGDADDLAYIFQQTVRADGLPAAARRTALSGLTEAALTRKIKPAGDLSELKRLIHPDEQGAHSPLRLAAIELAGAWKVDALHQDLQAIVLADQSTDQLRKSALDALVRIGNPESRKAVEKLTMANRPQNLRYLGVAALVEFDPDQAAAQAAQVMTDGTEADDPAPLLQAFLDLQGGADKLAVSLDDVALSVDVAKLALRYMYSVGRNDAALSSVLSRAAGITTEVEPPTPAEIKRLAAEVLAQGDPQRGEQIFRRADLSCMKCHSISGAGGNVGPDLSGVGASSPVEYLINSILMPDKEIKEEFLTVVVVTDEGKSFQGIVEEDSEDRLVLKEATGKRKVISKADILLREKGGSLMPNGLAQFLTHTELVDLLRFLSELGRPGPYAQNSEPTFQRWRVLRTESADLLGTVPSAEVVRNQALQPEEAAWRPAYAKVAGGLPLMELAAELRQTVLYVQSEIDVSSPGEVGIEIGDMDGLSVWVNEESVRPKHRITIDLPEGRHKITFRVDTDQRTATELRVKLFPVENATAQASPVRGT